MGRYLVLWEVDHSKIPIDRKERGTGWAFLMSMTRKDIEKGQIKDWGEFIGEAKGYAVVEGTELDVMNALQQYVPFCIFETHAVATESQVNELIKALTS